MVWERAKCALEGLCPGCTEVLRQKRLIRTSACCTVFQDALDHIPWMDRCGDNVASAAHRRIPRLCRHRFETCGSTLHPASNHVSLWVKSSGELCVASVAAPAKMLETLMDLTYFGLLCFTKKSIYRYYVYLHRSTHQWITLNGCVSGARCLSKTFISNSF